MTSKERLRESYNNVSYNADPVWSNCSNLYQKANLQLYARKKHLDENLVKTCRPRTVKDCIPNSRLAQYANYEYNESREMSYTTSNSQPTVFYNNAEPTEPWQMPEVEYLFHWFLQLKCSKKKAKFSVNGIQQNSNQHCDQFESSFMRVKGMEERILKARLTQTKIKQIWKKCDFRHDTIVPQSYNLTVQLCLSPANNFYILNKSDSNNISSNDFTMLHQLIQSIYEQHSSILKQTCHDKNGASSSAASLRTREKIKDNSTRIESKLHNPILLLQQQSVYFYRRTILPYWPPAYLPNWGLNWSTNRSITNQLFNQNNDAAVKIPQHHQLTATDSEELEIQALEQYQSSNENIFHEFEKQTQ